MRFNIGNIERELKDIVQRFPSSCCSIAIVAVLCFILLHDVVTIESYKDSVFRGILSGIIFFFLSIARVLFQESFKDHSSSLISKISGIIPIGFAMLFFFISSVDQSESELFTFFFFTLTGILAFIFFAPQLIDFRSSKTNNSSYYPYFYSMSSALFMASITGISTFILGAIAITAIETLFDISWYIMDDLYGDMALFSFVILSPLFGLSRLPKKDNSFVDAYKESLFFSFLLKFIAFPALGVYFIILYTYSVKVLLDFSQWPKGEVSWLVIGFSLFGYLTYIYSFIFQEKYRVIQTIRKIFPYVVLPQVVMLFYAIYLRIYQYDLTTNRYFVVLFGLFLLTISLYYIFSRQKKLIMIPSILCLFTIIFSFGPWSLYSLPESRQLARLKANLTEANILQGDTIVPLSKYGDISEELSSEIYGGISYMCDFDDCNFIKELFPNEYAFAIENSIGVLPTKEMMKHDWDVSKWTIVRSIADSIKVEQLDLYYRDTINFYLDPENQYLSPLNIDPYELLYNFDSYDNTNSQNYSYVDMDRKQLIVKQSNTIIEKVSLQSIFETLENSTQLPDAQLPLESMTFTGTGEVYDYKIIFKSITLLRNNRVSSAREYRTRAHGVLLLKKK